MSKYLEAKINLNIYDIDTSKLTKNIAFLVEIIEKLKIIFRTHSILIQLFE